MKDSSLVFIEQGIAIIGQAIKNLFTSARGLNRNWELCQQRLLNELLGLSRIGRLVNPPSNMPFAKIVENALSLTRGRLMAGHIKVDVGKDLPIIRGDHPRLVEVMQNLIDNAAKFMGDQSSPHNEIGARKEGNQQVLFVRDNGIGIDPSYPERVFGLFDTLDPISDGTGVGLATAKRIVEVHGDASGSNQRARAKEVCFASPSPSRNRS